MKTAWIGSVTIALLAVIGGCDLIAMPFVPSVPTTQYVEIPVKSASTWRYDGRLLYITVQPDYSQVERPERLKVLGGEGLIVGDDLLLSCTGTYILASAPRPQNVEIPAFYLPAGIYSVKANGKVLGQLHTLAGQGDLTPAGGPIVGGDASGGL